jgi:hypothetical protein
MSWSEKEELIMCNRAGANELTDLISATVEKLIADLRPSLVIALAEIAKATIDKAWEIQREVQEEGRIDHERRWTNL